MKKIIIIIIEDDKIVGKILQMKFSKKSEYEIFRAFDGEEGIKLIEEHKPDLIILDLAMPKKNGFEVLEYINIKYEKKDKNRPYIFVSTNLSSEDDKKKVLDLGADIFVNKSSSTISSIVEAVEKVL